MFGDDSDDDNDAASNLKRNNGASAVQEIGGLDDLLDTPTRQEDQDTRKKSRPKGGAPPSQPPKLKPKTQQSSAMFGDLSSALSARKNAEAAEQLDPSVYEYDAVYDSLRPEKKKDQDAPGEERKPRYMKGLMQAADVRKRDQLIAEEKKIARDREAEGDEFADKEKFVTEAYKRQQEENRRIEEEEKRREEAEAEKNKDGGMSSFYRSMLNRDEERHAQAVKAADEAAKQGPKQDKDTETNEEEETEAKRVKELTEKGASIAVNEDGQVVDKRQLLKGGLNLSAKPSAAQTQKEGQNSAADRANKRPMSGAQIGSKQAMRERQSRMLAEQLEQSMKRSREANESQREETERAAKSRKTDGDISSAKERYLARKRAAEEEKKSTGNA